MTDAQTPFLGTPLAPLKMRETHTPLESEPSQDSQQDSTSKKETDALVSSPAKEDTRNSGALSAPCARGPLSRREVSALPRRTGALAYVCNMYVYMYMYMYMCVYIYIYMCYIFIYIYVYIYIYIDTYIYREREREMCIHAYSFFGAAPDQRPRVCFLSGGSLP